MEDSTGIDFEGMYARIDRMLELLDELDELEK